MAGNTFSVEKAEWNYFYTPRVNILKIILPSIVSVIGTHAHCALGNLLGLLT